MIKIRAFRAVDEPEACERYLEGHMRVLKIFGITPITSAKADWITDPTCYVMIAESSEEDKIFGGARIELAGRVRPLPIEVATGQMDSYVYDLVKAHSRWGSGELCGLWNSREVAGMGIGSIFLGRVGVAIASQLKLRSLFALCAPATVENCLKMGLQIETTIGNQGTFYYPKDNLVATAMLLKDVDTLSLADPATREYMLDLRRNPIQARKEAGRRGDFEVEYDLSIGSFHYNDSEQILNDYSKNFQIKTLSAKQHQ